MHLGERTVPARLVPTGPLLEQLAQRRLDPHPGAEQDYAALSAAHAARELNQKATSPADRQLDGTEAARIVESRKTPDMLNPAYRRDIAAAWMGRR